MTNPTKGEPMTDPLTKVLEELVRPQLLPVDKEQFERVKKQQISQAHQKIIGLIPSEETLTGLINDVMIRINKNDFTLPQYVMREEEIAKAIHQQILDNLTGD